MKILFICGSLELGRDGVGDYTRRISAEIIRQGHEVRAIGLNEKQIKQPITEKQYDDGVDVEVLRIPDYYSVKERFGLAKNWTDEFSPDWISLQFVPYSFNKKGICFGLGKQLKALSTKAKWHIMFHELWIGKDKNSDWKLWFVSQLQKMAIKSLDKAITPNVIHTQLPVFYSKLNDLGWAVKRLPLFANISVVSEEMTKDDNVFRIGFFSQVETGEAIMTFLNTIALQIQSNDLKPEIILIGGNAERMKQSALVFERIKNCTVKYIGFLEPLQLADVIKTCDMGITPIPRHALGKSGSVAAFISYGIPVASPIVHFCYDKANIGFFSERLCESIIIEPTLDKWQTAQKSAGLGKGEIKLSHIAQTFLFDLDNEDKIVN